eukprot:6284792-Heterocapsa_arctica.AAC.1
MELSELRIRNLALEVKLKRMPAVDAYTVLNNMQLMGLWAEAEALQKVLQQTPENTDSEGCDYAESSNSRACWPLRSPSRPR